ncbi:MAG: hypothetical protein MPW16_15095 [Candidatus Manganitrophus sp.]|nr:MAG: hypothetical protein MPW16_15095 [Candidatus Manganitrophus sp.]
MSAKTVLNTLHTSFPGMLVTGVTGGLIGSFIGGPFWIILAATIGALIGMVVWCLGGRRFFIFIVVGALLGGLLALLIAGPEQGLIGAATGGAMGGFIAVNFLMMRPRQPS